MVGATGSSGGRAPRPDLGVLADDGDESDLASDDEVRARGRHMICRLHRTSHRSLLEDMSSGAFFAGACMDLCDPPGHAGK